MARRDFPEVSGYLPPTIGSTEVASGATVTTVAGLTLSNPTLTGTLTAGGGVGTSGQVLQSTGTGVEWEDGIPSYTGGSTQELLSDFLNVGISGVSYGSAGLIVTISGGGAADQSGLDAFNQLDEFTLSYSNAGTAYSTTFERIAALTDMGTGTLVVPEQYVSGNASWNASNNPVTITYTAPSESGKFLTNDGTNLSWGSGGMTLLHSFSSNPQYAVGFNVSQAYKKIVVYVSDVSGLNPTYLSISPSSNGTALLVNNTGSIINLNNNNGNSTANNAFMFTIHNYSDSSIYTKFFEASSAYESDDGAGGYQINQENISGFIQGGTVTDLDFGFFSSSSNANIRIYGSN